MFLDIHFETTAKFAFHIFNAHRTSFFPQNPWTPYFCTEPINTELTGMEISFIFWLFCQHPNFLMLLGFSPEGKKKLSPSVFENIDKDIDNIFCRLL